MRSIQHGTAWIVAIVLVIDGAHAVPGLCLDTHGAASTIQAAAAAVNAVPASAKAVPTPATAKAAAPADPWPLGYVNLTTPLSGPQDAPGFARSTVHFPCGGVKCEAWLYAPKRPAGAKPAPLILMANGVGCQKDMGLQRFAEPLVAAGAAVFVFDYRTFGGSEGVPRNWISAPRHIEDWLSAADFVQGPGFAATAAEKGIDASKLGLWGSSFGGGHVIVVAAKLGERVSAVVSQVPHLSSDVAAFYELTSMSPSQMAVMLNPSLDDIAASLTGSDAPLAPGEAMRLDDRGGNITYAYSSAPGGVEQLRAVYFELWGRKGSFAIMQLADSDLKQFWQSHSAPDYQGGWRNLARASFSQESIWSSYSPILLLPLVKAPLLMVAGAQDNLCPTFVARKAKMILSALPGSEYVEFDTTHFGMYMDPILKPNTVVQAAFVKKHLVA